MSALAYAHQYRDLDLAARVDAASPHQLVAMLFDGLRGALAASARAVAGGQVGVRIRCVVKALAILDALETSLDFAAGRSVARALAAAYDAIRALIVAGHAEARADLLSAAAERAGGLGEAWAATR